MGERIADSIIVKGDAAELFDLTADIETFPRVLDEVKAVRRIGERTSRWIMHGPGGEDLVWEAEITRLEEPKRMAWRTLGGDIRLSGQVTFNALPDQQTEVTVMLLWGPPAGQSTAAATANELQRKLNRALRSLKHYVERSHLGQPQGRA